MRVLRKELGQQEELLFLQVALIEQFKRYEFILFIYLYLLKDKKDKEVYISVGIRVYNKYILFWRGSNVVCIPLRGNPF